MDMIRARGGNNPPLKSLNPFNLVSNTNATQNTLTIDTSTLKKPGMTMTPSPRGQYLSEGSGVDDDDDGPPGLEDISEDQSPGLLLSQQDSGEQQQAAQKQQSLKSSEESQNQNKEEQKQRQSQQQQQQKTTSTTITTTQEFLSPQIVDSEVERKSVKSPSETQLQETGSQTRFPIKLVSQQSMNSSKVTPTNNSNKRGSMRQSVLRRRTDIVLNEDRSLNSARDRSSEWQPLESSRFYAGNGSSSQYGNTNNPIATTITGVTLTIPTPSIRIESPEGRLLESSRIVKSEDSDLLPPFTSEELRSKQLKVLEEVEGEHDENEQGFRYEGGIKQPSDQAIFKYIEHINESIRFANEKIDGLPRFQKARKLIQVQIEDLTQILGSETESKKNESPHTSRRSKGSYLQELLLSKKESLRYIKEAESLIEDLNRQSKICSKMGRTLLDFHSIISIELSNLRTSSKSNSEVAELVSKHESAMEAKNAELDAEREKVRQLTSEVSNEVERRMQAENELESRMVHFTKLYEDAHEAKAIITQEMKNILQQKEALRLRSEALWEKENMLGLRPHVKNNKTTTGLNNTHSLSPFRKDITEAQGTKNFESRTEGQDRSVNYSSSKPQSSFIEQFASPFQQQQQQQQQHQNKQVVAQPSQQSQQKQQQQQIQSSGTPKGRYQSSVDQMKIILKEFNATSTATKALVVGEASSGRSTTRPFGNRNDNRSNFSPSEFVEDAASMQSRAMPQLTKISDGATKFSSASSRMRGDSFGVQPPQLPGFAHPFPNLTPQIITSDRSSLHSVSPFRSANNQQKQYSTQQKSFGGGTVAAAGAIQEIGVSTPKKKENHMHTMKQMIELIQSEKESLIQQMNTSMNGTPINSTTTSHFNNRPF